MKDVNIILLSGSTNMRNPQVLSSELVNLIETQRENIEKSMLSAKPDVLVKIDEPFPELYGEYIPAVLDSCSRALEALSQVAAAGNSPIESQLVPDFPQFDRVEIVQNLGTSGAILYMYSEFYPEWRFVVLSYGQELTLPAMDDSKCFSSI